MNESTLTPGRNAAFQTAVNLLAQIKGLSSVLNVLNQAFSLELGQWWEEDPPVRPLVETEPTKDPLPPPPPPTLAKSIRRKKAAPAARSDAPKLDLELAIVGHLQQHSPARKAEIAVTLGVKPDQLTYTLGKLIKAGSVVGEGTTANRMFRWAAAAPAVSTGDAVIPKRVPLSERLRECIKTLHEPFHVEQLVELLAPANAAPQTHKHLTYSLAAELATLNASGRIERAGTVEGKVLYRRI